MADAIFLRLVEEEFGNDLFGGFCQKPDDISDSEDSGGLADICSVGSVLASGFGS